MAPITTLSFQKHKRWAARWAGAKKKTAEEDEIKKLTKEFDHASFQNIFHNIPLPLERQPTITKIIVLSFFKGLFDAMFDTIALWPHVAAIVVQSDKTVF